MALSLPSPPIPPPPPPPLCSNPNPSLRSQLLWIQSRRRSLSILAAVSSASGGHHSLQGSSPPSLPSDSEALSPFSALLIHLAASSALFLLGFRAPACALGSQPISPPTIAVSSEACTADSSGLAAEELVDEDLRSAFQNFKSKTYALTVPLRIVALQGSVPPSWIKDFIQSQGRRLRFTCEFRGTLESIFSDLSLAGKKGCLEPKSVMSADIVSIGDSWLSCAIAEGLIEPMQHVEQQDWFKGLGQKWKSYLCRNNKGEVDSNGYIWAAPYRWGSMVIAYKKNKFEKNSLTPIEDWRDLWRPELAGKISMVDCPREVVGAVLKYMGASYNTKNLDSEVPGGRNAVMDNLIMLQKQVQLFDSKHYLKAFGAGDVWVAVGWSNDIIPAVKRMSNVAVVVPKSGASLWADLWAIPSATRFNTACVGGRVRSPSPLIYQWMEFCLQIVRGLPFQQEVVPGASPCALEQLPAVRLNESTSRRPKLDTNLVDGIPPTEILAQCEFLEPLPENTSVDYQWLLHKMPKTGGRLIERVLNHLLLGTRKIGSAPH